MALSPSQVILYAADSSDFDIALGAAALAGIPADNVTGDFYSAWNYTANGAYLVIAVGGAAANALYFNPCGWGNPAGQAGGSTPFALTSYPIATLPGANYFETAAGNSAADTLQLAAAFAYDSVHGSTPSEFSSYPAPVSPVNSCWGSDRVTCPCLPGVNWSCGSSGNRLGLDISSNNVSATATSSFWTNAKSAGYTFVIIKATEGVSYVNPAAAGQYSAAESVLGIDSIGFYHFLDWQYSGAEQAQNFFKAVSGMSPAFTYSSGFNLWLDVEEPNGQSSTGAPTIIVVNEFMNELASLYGAPVSEVAGIYTNYDTWVNYLGNPTDYAGSRLWPASPNGVSSCPSSFGGWPDWTLMQFGTNAAVDGYSGFDVDEQI